MRALLVTLVTNSAAMSAAALSLMLLDAALLKRRRLPARALRWAWLIVLAGFICPLRPDLGALMALVPRAQPALGALRGRLADAVPLLAGTPAGASLPSTAAQSTLARSAAAAATEPGWQPDWTLIFALAYIAGAALTLGLALWRHWRFRRTVLRWNRPADAALGELSRARIVISRAVSQPLLMGALRPVIALPERELPDGELRAMIAHEECHRANRDIWIQYAALLARALNWFNPLMPLVAAELTLKCEQLCDELTLTCCALNRRSYADTILAAAATRRAPLTTGFSGGKYAMKRRLTALYSRSAPRAGALILALALALTIFAPALMALAAEADTTPSDDAPTATDSQPQPTPAALNEGLTAANMLQNVLTIALAANEGDYATNALQLLAAGSGVDTLVDALNMYGRIEAIYLGEGLAFEQLAQQYPELANRAMYDLVVSAAEPELAERAQLMLAAGELLPEVYARLGMDGYEQSDAADSDLLDAALAIMQAYFGGDDMTGAMLILSAGDAVDALLSALELYGQIETAYLKGGLTFEQLAEQYPELANRALYELAAGAPETGLAERAQLMFASGELFPAIYDQLALGEYDVRSALCACLAYNLARHSGRIAEVLSAPDVEMRIEADTALNEWCAATGRGDLFGIAAPAPEPTAAARASTAFALNGGDSPDAVFSDMLAITLTRSYTDDLTVAHLILASGDGAGGVIDALDAYDRLERAHVEQGLTFEEIVAEYGETDPTICDEATYELMVAAPQTGIATRAKLMLASGELFDELYARLALGRYESIDLLCACIAYNMAANEGRIVNIYVQLDVSQRAQALNALTEWIAAVGDDSLFGPLDAVRAEIDGLLAA